MLVGFGSPSHLIFLRRHVSQATTTLLRFFVFGSDGLGASSAFDFEVDATFARLVCDAFEVAEGELAETLVLSGDTAGNTDVDVVAATAAGEFSKERLDRPLRIETSSKATCVSSSLLYAISDVKAEVKAT